MHEQFTEEMMADVERDMRMFSDLAVKIGEKWKPILQRFEMNDEQKVRMESLQMELDTILRSIEFPV